jgi:hypothetical protein
MKAGARQVSRILRAAGMAVTEGDGMKVWTVTHYGYVEGVFTDRDRAHRVARDRATAHEETTEWEVRPETASRSEVFYKPARSGRWNRSKVFITEGELNA